MALNEISWPKMVTRAVQVPDDMMGAPEMSVRPVAVAGCSLCPEGINENGEAVSTRKDPAVKGAEGRRRGV